jgi:hypothetical protein
MSKLNCLKTLLIIIILSGFLFSQENNASPSVEFYIGTRRLSPGSTTKTVFNFKAIGKIWARVDGDACYGSPENLCYLNSDYLSGSYTTIGNSNSTASKWEGIDFFASSNFGSATNDIAYGLYKISVKDENLYFYFDWRDSDYPYAAAFFDPGGPSAANDV